MEKKGEGKGRRSQSPSPEEEKPLRSTPPTLWLCTAPHHLIAAPNCPAPLPFPPQHHR